MTSVVRALRRAGAKAWLVSMPVLGHESERRYSRGVLLRSFYGPSLFLPTVSNRWFRKLVAAIGFATFCGTRVRAGDRVILYNHAFEYLLGLCVLKLRGVHVTLDIEDAPRDDEPGFLAWMLRHIFPLTSRLTDKRKVIVSQALAVRLGVEEFCPIYGAIGIDQTRSMTECEVKWRSLKEGAPLRIHYGGSLSEDTGVTVFCDSVRLLAERLSSHERNVLFHITGVGGESQLRALQGSFDQGKVRIIWRKNLPPDEYLGELRKCHAALSLRVPGSSMAETTFPSKIVEITGNGLLLITTRVSDVPLLFDENNAVLLDELSAHMVVEGIMEILNDLDGMRIRAFRGHRRAAELFGELGVGERLISFVGINVGRGSDHQIVNPHNKQIGGISS